jgi:translation initiation factor 2 subunit 1
MAYYSNSLPTPGDYVIVTLKSFSEGGVYVNLVEYENIEGFILLTQISRRKKRPDSIFMFGKFYPVVVLSVNAAKKTIDLSYKDVKPTEIEPLLEDFDKKKRLYQICHDMISITKLPYDTVMNNTFRKFLQNKKIFDAISEFYENILDEPKLIGLLFEPGYESELKAYVENLKTRITVSDMSMKQDINLIVFDEDAITKLKSILSTDTNIKHTQLYFMAHSTYQIIASGPTKEKCLKLLKKVTDAITKNASTVKCKLVCDDPFVGKAKQFTIRPLHPDLV